MRFLIFVTALFMLLYLIGSALSSAPITLLVTLSVIGSAASHVPYGQVYAIMVAVYIIAMLVLFIMAFTLPKKSN